MIRLLHKLRKPQPKVEPCWMLFDLETNNAIDMTTDPLIALQWWIKTRAPDSDFYIFPDDVAEIRQLL